MIRHVSVLSIFVSAIIVTGCTPPTISPSVPPDISQDFHLQLQRFGCYGPCPIYTVDVDAFGEITYHGTRFVRYVGEDHAFVSRSIVSVLYDSCNAANFAAMDSVYGEWWVVNDTSMTTITDCPSANVRVTFDSTSYFIRDYLCNPNTPHVLRRLEDAVDSVLNTDRWIK